MANDELKATMVRFCPQKIRSDTISGCLQGPSRPPFTQPPLRCGPDNKRTKEKRKTIKIKEKRKFEKQTKILQN